MTTDTVSPRTEEPLLTRLWRQVDTEQIDEERLLASAEKRTRQLGKKLEKDLAENGWRKFVAGQAYVIAHGKAPQRRNAELSLIETVTRWKREIAALCPERMPRLREIVAASVENPQPLPPRE